VTVSANSTSVSWCDYVPLRFDEEPRQFLLLRFKCEACGRVSRVSHHGEPPLITPGYLDDIERRMRSFHELLFCVARRSEPTRPED
jgi:hypothetical protein